MAGALTQPGMNQVVLASSRRVLFVAGQTAIDI